MKRFCNGKRKKRSQNDSKRQRQYEKAGRYDGEGVGDGRRVWVTGGGCG